MAQEPEWLTFGEAPPTYPWPQMPSSSSCRAEFVREAPIRFSASASTFDEKEIEEMIRNLQEGSGMREIREWLKSLRLHKYTKILLELSYEELLQLNDEVLERKNVTLGARGKILKYIGHIKERPRTIKKLGKDIEVRNYQKCLILRQK